MYRNETTMQTHSTKDSRGKSGISVVIPTYCEGEHIRSLIIKIRHLLTDAEIIIVDDSSPDGTSEKVKELMSKYKNIKLITRPAKLGLGSAIREGLRVSTSMEPQPEYVVTMDADYSHIPEDIPKLVSAAEQGYDLVIGSRYRKGSKIIGGKPTRLIFSRLLNLIVAFLFRVNVSDSTSGFRCYSNRFIKNILPQLHSQTYEIQVETLKQARLKKFNLAEVPITFIDCKRGKSKLSMSRSARLMLLLLLGRKDRVVEDNRIKLNIEVVTELMKSWKNTIDNLIAKRKEYAVHEN